MSPRRDCPRPFRLSPILAAVTLLVAGGWLAAPAFAQACMGDPDCDDGYACNGQEFCNAMLQCQGGAPVVCNDSDPCTLDFCQEPSGSCLFQLSADAESAEGPDQICLTRDDDLGLFGPDGLCGTGDDLTGDGLCEVLDNCDVWSNPGQEDGDGDGVGDVCDQFPCTGPGLLAVGSGSLKRVDRITGEESLIEFGLDTTTDVATNGAATLAAVAEQITGRISVVDLATQQIVNQIMTTAPWSLDFNPAGTVIYFTDRATGEVESVNALGCCPTFVTFGVGDARGIDVNASGTLAYVTDYSSGTIWRVTLATGSKVPFAGGLVGPMGIVLSPDESEAYVIERDAGTLSSVDTTTGAVTPILGGMSLTGGIELNEAGTIAYVMQSSTSGYPSIGQIDLSAPALMPLSFFSLFPGFDPGLARVPQPGPIMSLPNGATGLPPGSIVVPVSIDDLTGQGVISADVVVEFNPAVLTASSVALGPLTSACTLTDNLSDPGRAVISIFCASPLAGAGALAEITFDVTGASGTGTPLRMTSPLLNEGTPDVCPDAGDFFVPVEISGTIRYYRDSVVMVEPSTKPVDDATVYLGYEGSGSSPTSCTGTFSFAPLTPAFSYSITPYKTNDALGAVDPFDASLNAQHVVGLISLTASQRVAADVSANGTLTSFDSALIAQYSVGTITQFPAAAITGSDWVFDPVPQGEPNQFVTDPVVPLGVPGSIRYQPILEDAESQNFLGILLGDVSGNWQGTCPGTAPGTGGPESAAAGVAARQAPQKDAGAGASLSLPVIRAAAGEIISVPVRATGVSGAVSSYLDLRFDASVIRLISVARGDAASRLSITSNTSGSGRARVALYGTAPVTGDGDLIVATFEIIGRPGSRSPLALAATTVNEGQIPVAVKEGRVTVLRNGQR